MDYTSIHKGEIQMARVAAKTPTPEDNEIMPPPMDGIDIPDALPVMDVTGYTTDVKFYATRYKQGGRTVYSLDLSLEQIASLITPPDPNMVNPGNRAIRPAHAEGFAKYLREQKAWVMPGMILRAPAIFDFAVQAEVSGVQFGVISFPRRAMADLHILDGQHRILGINLAMKGIAVDLDKARSNLASARRVDPSGVAVKDAETKIKSLNTQRERLDNERASMTIFVEEDPKAYRQMFFDIADNALGITASVRSRFDSRKVVNRALEPVMLHPLLLGRIDKEGDRVSRGSIYMVGAKHVAEIIRACYVGLDGRVSRRQEDEFKEKDLAAKANIFLDILIEAFPQMKAVSLGQLTPDMLRKSSLLGSVLFLRVLAGAYWELTNKHAFDDDMVSEFFAELAPHVNGGITETGIWTAHMPDQLFNIGGFAPRGRRQDLQLLKEVIVDWAIEKPDFIEEAPVLPPEEEKDPEFGSGYTNHGADIPGI